jgi:hypothetical protein
MSSAGQRLAAGADSFCGVADHVFGSTPAASSGNAISRSADNSPALDPAPASMDAESGPTPFHGDPHAR